MPESGRLAVYDAPNKPFEIRRFPIRTPRAGEALDRRHRPGPPRHPSGIRQAIPGEP